MNRITIFSISVIILLITAVGCNKPSAINEVPTEPESVSIAAEIFMVDSLLGKPISMTVTDNELIVAEDNTNDTLVSVYSLDGVPMNRFLVKGSGPGAALWVPNVQYSRRDQSLYVPDLMKNTMLHIVNYRDGSPQIEKVFDYDSSKNDSILLSGRIGKMSDGTYLAANGTCAGMVALFAADGSQICTDIAYPDKSKVDDKLTDAANAMLYQSILRVSPDGDFGALFSNSADFRIFANLNNGKINLVSFEDAYPNDIYVIQFDAENAQGASTSKTKYYTLDLSLSNEYAYELHIGMADKDIRETEFFKDAKVYGSNTVRVYDRKGNHVKTITLDRWATVLAVSPDDSYLYTLTQSSEDGYTVLRYEL